MHALVLRKVGNTIKDSVYAQMKWAIAKLGLEDNFRFKVSPFEITHIPTGVVVSCQTERSQHKNRETAMKMLRSKLAEIAEQQHKEKIEDIKGVQKEIAWGSQIRSYVFHPYNMVKDHRTGYEVGNIGAVMDGDLDGFINAYLRAASLGQLNLK